jgi:hypothetical protein
VQAVVSLSPVDALGRRPIRPSRIRGPTRSHPRESNTSQQTPSQPSDRATVRVRLTPGRPVRVDDPGDGRLNLEAYTRRDSLVNDFLSEVFCEKHDSDGDWRYNLSVAIAEKLIPDDFFAGLIYPTVPMWGNADNFALKPSFVTTSLTPVYVEYIEVTEVHDTSFAINALDEARSFGSDGTIKWLGHPAQWTLSAGEGVICEAVEGRWVAHNLRGEIDEPD